ncbi:VgrG-related protein [Kribbella qitaiheensis]|uniref:VgrG-related protein n=1 Tax=Kribbella qitaiheensis TaxID=1544730 RepID=A0A7G6X5P5_9ACTN|nr:VgrG-related protein [Kribbella qitaiheensis]QNE21560.1 VgrG-related protein [Kribbella qitaiheensis]
MSIINSCLVEINSSPLPADVVNLMSTVYVDDSQRLPDLFEIRFRDGDHEVLRKTGAKIGSAVRISVLASTSQAPVLLMAGEITALEAEFDTGGSFTVLRGYDPAHRLFRGRGTASYLQMTASDIAQKVSQRAGFTNGTIKPTTTVFEHVSQAGTSDWELLDALAADSGYEVSVRDGKFNFGPPATAAGAPSNEQNPLVLKLGTDLLRFRAVLTSGGQVKEVEVRGWDTSTKHALTTRHPAKTTSAELPQASPAEFAHAFGDKVYVATDVPHRTQAEVDAAAAAISAEIAGSFAEFTGVAQGNPALKAGVAITVDNLGAPFDGKYTVTTTRHRIDPTTGYTTSFAVTGAHDRSLLGLTGSSGAQRAPSGVVIGQVSDNNDPEKLGRVKVTLPWLSDDYVSAWARTVHAGAGKDRGALIIPEVGDEVLVVFEQGDLRRPYVLGGLYNGVDKPDAKGIDPIDSGSGAVNRRSIVSRKGHRIDLLDQDGQKEGITLATGDGKLSVTLDSTSTTITVHADGTVKIEGSQGIVIDAAAAKLELKGGEVSVTATGNLQLKGANTTVEGSANTEVKGGAMCSVSAALVKIN